MSKLWLTYLKDMKLSVRGLYFYIEMGMALIFVTVLLFVVPDEFQSAQKLTVVLPNTMPALTETLTTKEFQVDQVQHREEVIAALEEDHSQIGIVVDDSGEIEFILQGYEGEKTESLLKATIVGRVKSLFVNEPITLSTRVLQPNAERLTSKQSILPIYLTMNVALMGLFIIAAYIYLDKDEGVIKAYHVAPVHLWQYLASKLLLMNTVGVVTSLFVCIAIMGLRINYFYLIVLVVLYNTFGSSLGLWLSSFAQSMTKAMGFMYFAIIILLLPAVSYMAPSFTPGLIKWFPTYPMLFSFRDLLLNDISLQQILTQAGIFLALTLVFFTAATRRYKKTLTI